jgi:hypothetical protein
VLTDALDKCWHLSIISQGRGQPVVLRTPATGSPISRHRHHYVRTTLYRELARNVMNVPSQVPDPPLGTPCPSRYVVTVLLNRSSENLKSIFFSKPSPSFNFRLLFNCLPVYVKPRLDSNLCKSRYTSTQMLLLILSKPRLNSLRTRFELQEISCHR